MCGALLLGAPAISIALARFYRVRSLVATAIGFAVQASVVVLLAMAVLRLPAGD
jgi:hypothetical protein